MTQNLFKIAHEALLSSWVKFRGVTNPSGNSNRSYNARVLGVAEM